MNLTRPAWGTPSDLWVFDGSWKDVYLKNADISDWQKFLDLVKKFSFVYKFDQKEKEMPAPEEIFSDRSGVHFLGLKIGRVSLCCHFFQRAALKWTWIRVKLKTKKIKTYCSIF